MTLVEELTWFCTSRGILHEAARWMESFLGLPPGAEDGERARVLMQAANIAQWQGRYAAAAGYSHEAFFACQSVDDHLGMAYAQRQLGSIAIN